MDDFGDQIQSYAADLKSFVARYDLPAAWFVQIDHLACKFRDAKHFEEGIEFFRPLASEVTCADLDGRRLATAHLQMSIEVGDFGEVSWVEIMEPKPEKIGKDIVGFEHVEFFYPNFDEIREVLDKRGVAYEMQQNPSHSWVNIVINLKGQELKLNDGTLEAIIKSEIDKGVGYVI